LLCLKPAVRKKPHGGFEPQCGSFCFLLALATTAVVLSTVALSTVALSTVALSTVALSTVALGTVPAALGVFRRLQITNFDVFLFFCHN
jgi:hypothetical protein